VGERMAKGAKTAASSERTRRGRPPKKRAAQTDPERARSLKIRRFELKLSEIDFERIERLLGLTGAASMGEVIRDAVREYEARILSGKKTNT
jgi:Ribbon-helix-helix protein, copG family